MPLSATVTGIETTGDTCVPEAVPSEPEVETPAAGAVPVPVLVPAAGAVLVELPSPRTPMPLPPIVTGTSTRPVTWVPESSPSVPEVVGADGVSAAGAGVVAAGAVDVEVPSPRTTTSC